MIICLLGGGQDDFWDCKLFNDNKLENMEKTFPKKRGGSYEKKSISILFLTFVYFLAKH